MPTGRPRLIAAIAPHGLTIKVWTGGRGRSRSSALEYRNYTDLERSPEFILRQLEPFDTSELKLHLKWHRRKDQEVSGYYRFEDNFVMAAVRAKQRFPLKNEWPVGTSPSRGRRRWKWVWDREKACDRDELMVWIAGHELFHFLRHTKQVPGINRETRANRFAFEWMRRYMAERGASAAEPPATHAPTAPTAPRAKPAVAAVAVAAPLRKKRDRRGKRGDVDGQMLMPWEAAS